MAIDSGINLGLPELPLTDDKKLFRDLVPIYNAIHILQQVLADTGIAGGTGATTTGYIDWSHISGFAGDDQLILESRIFGD